MQSRKRFGIPEEQFLQIEEALDEQAIYSMPDEQAELAFELFQAYDPEEMDIAFDFVARVAASIKPTPPEIGRLRAKIRAEKAIAERCLREDLDYEAVKKVSSKRERR